jgi:hypothetical protein
MDFATLDLKAASERGSWVHLHYRGEPLGGEDKPSRLKVRGMGASAVMDAYRKVERVTALRAERMARTADKDADAVLAKSQGDLEAAMAELIVAAVAEWENIEWEGKPLALTADNVLKLCGPGTLFFGQVNDAISEAHRLFTVADSA